MAVESYKYRDPMLVLMQQQEYEHRGMKEVIDPFGEKIWIKETKQMKNVKNQKIPVWVSDEIWNWVRWCWTGTDPRPASYGTLSIGVSGDFKPAENEVYQDAPEVSPELQAIIDYQERIATQYPTPINFRRAMRVDMIHRSLPLIDQRIINYEYPRRHELYELTHDQRRQAIAAKLGIHQASCDLVIMSFKRKILQELK